MKTKTKIKSLSYSNGKLRPGNLPRVLSPRQSREPSLQGEGEAGENTPREPQARRSWDIPPTPSLGFYWHLATALRVLVFLRSWGAWWGSGCKASQRGKAPQGMAAKVQALALPFLAT